MSVSLSLKPSHKAVKSYYAALAQLASVGAKHESAVREAWHSLIEHCAAPLKWTLVREYSVTRKGAAPLRLDAVLLDSYRIPHGVIEDKDNADDLADELTAKLKLGYPSKNTLFWQPSRAMLVQNGGVVLDVRIDDDANHLCEVLSHFFSYIEPVIADWERATEEFRERVAELGRSVREVIQRARGIVGTIPNKKFVAAFNDFASLCRAAINPGLSDEAIEEMLIQHLLTARLFGSVFNNPDFTRRNVIAVEIEKVIDALSSGSGNFDRRDFLKKLDRFYLAIEEAAKLIEDFSEKQKFLNTVYEKFFQGFAVRVADTMGIVYTPPSIVLFIITSIRDLLKKGFGKDLDDEGVHFLDPFTGTGNFLVHLMRELPRASLLQKYSGELWANEIMLLPYYIAALNIEHEFFEKMGSYEAFPGLCLVDTFELAEPHDQTEMSFLSAINTERVNAQKKAPIRVILGNPPYNAWQQDENDNNKNRKYSHLDRRIKNTFATDSTATLKNSLSDPYIKAIRWASDRIGEEGIVAYVTNSGYVDGLATDGVRAHLAKDFDIIYILDLGGNVRKNPKLSGSTHNVFGIQVGVSIAFFVRYKQKELKKRKCVVHYAAVGVDWRKEEKWKWLGEKKGIAGVKWRTLIPDDRNTWLHDNEAAGFSKLIPMGSKEAKAQESLDAKAIFRTYCLGLATKRDDVVYDLQEFQLGKRIERFIDNYNSEVLRWKTKGKPDDIDNFVNYEKVKWSESLKSKLRSERYGKFSRERIRVACYRPFSTRFVYLDDLLIDRPSLAATCFPKDATTTAICVNLSPERPFTTLAVDKPIDFVAMGGFGCSSFAFPLYTYDSNGGHRQDNVTDWALEQFEEHYPGIKLSKADIFHYVYALLHHASYREKFASNLRRELPRIPLASDFKAFAKAGEKLLGLHIGYELQKEFKLKRIEARGVKPDWRVERMKLNKEKTELIYNEWLTLSGIPAEVLEYRLGNRSALEWVIDQYRVERGVDGEPISDPNRTDDEEYIVRLVGKVATVSIETVKLMSSLPLKIGSDE